ncbi:hypothetical protein B0H21DRAFT_714183, partial [Amylocystis lapponica]
TGLASEFPPEERTDQTPIADALTGLVLDAHSVSPVPSYRSRSLSYEDLNIAPPDTTDANMTPPADDPSSPASSHRSLSYVEGMQSPPCFSADIPPQEEPRLTPEHEPHANQDAAAHSPMLQPNDHHSPPHFDADVPPEEPRLTPEHEPQANHDAAAHSPMLQPNNPSDADVPIEMPPASHQVLEDSSEVWFWRVVMLLCSWLHLQYHVPYRACTLILQVMRLIFITVGLLTRDSDAPITLLTSLHRLQLRDNFEIKAMCISCCRVYDGNSDTTLQCSTCNIPLFKSTSTNAPPEPAPDTADTSDQPAKPPLHANVKTSVPRLQTPYSLLSAQLPEARKSDELRIGVTLGFDGYQSRNLILCGLTPGPKELTADELQHFMKAYVDDYCSWFGDHNTKEGFCSRCKIKHADLNTEAGVTIDAFPPRDGEEHRRHAQEYLQQADSELREAFFKQHAARYYELSRLPYFDAVRMTVIDPMHNILLGVVKTQWLDAWIHTKTLRERTPGKKVPRELDKIHEYLKNFEIPRWAARLPHDVGYPAGGSLTADEWKGMAMNYCPAIIPLIWDEWQPSAQALYEKRLSKWTKAEKARVKRIAKGKRRADGTEEPAAPKPKVRMHSQDADNFLSLASALKILMARTIDRSDLPRARSLLQNYLHGFMKIHPENVKPNFHYMTHIFDQIEDYGPVYGFWTFLTERLNKVLKSYATNNHAGGEIEVTFFRAFSRDVRLRRLLNELASLKNLSPEDEAAANAARLILKTDGDQRGTVAALAHPNEQVEHDLRSRFSLDGGTQEVLERTLQLELRQFYEHKYPMIPIVDITCPSPPPAAHFLHTTIRKHNHVVLDGRRIRPSRGQGTYAPDSIIQANFAGTRYVGEVFQVLTHFQPGVGRETHLLHVQWFRRLTGIDTSPWDPYPELEVAFWEYNGYLNPRESGPPAFVLISDILSQACRVTIKLYPIRPQSNTLDIFNTDDSEDEDVRMPGKNQGSGRGVSGSRRMTPHKDVVVCADEMPSGACRMRFTSSLSPRPGSGRTKSSGRISTAPSEAATSPKAAQVVHAECAKHGIGLNTTVREKRAGAPFHFRNVGNMAYLGPEHGKVHHKKSEQGTSRRGSRSSLHMESGESGEGGVEEVRAARVESEK